MGHILSIFVKWYHETNASTTMSSSSIQGVLDVVNISKWVVELAAVTDTCCEGLADSFGHLLDVGLAVDLGHRVALLHRQRLGNLDRLAEAVLGRHLMALLS